jgi:O-antigen/teichoic acid export membrane protein
VYQIGITLLNFIIIILITRLLGVDGRGHVAIYNNAVAIATTVFGISLGSAMVYFIASKKIIVQQAFSVVLQAVLVALILLSLSCFFVYLFGFQYIITPFQNNGYLLIFYVAHVVFTIFNININAILNANENFIFPMRLQFAFAAILCIALFFFQFDTFHWMPISAANIVIFLVLFYVLQTIMLWMYAVKKYSLSMILWRIPKPIYQQIFTFSAMAFACNVIQMLSYRIDLWFLQYYHTAAIVGVYSIAVLCIQMLWILPNQFATVLYTKFNQHQQSAKLIAFVTNITALTFWICLLLFGFFFLCSFIGIPLLFGIDFAQSVPLFGILLLGAIPIGSAIIISTFNASANMLKINLIGSIIGFIFCIIFNFILIPNYNYYGAAFASVIAYVSNCIYLYYQFCKANKVNVKDLFIPNVTYIKNIKLHWHAL